MITASSLIRFVPFCLITLSTALTLGAKGITSALPYRDPGLPIETRIEDLLGRMTLEEKIGQMCQYVAPERLRVTSPDKTELLSDDDDETAQYPGLSIHDVWNMTSEGHIGSFLQVLTVEEARKLQALAASSRLGIPLLLGTDAIHGAAMLGGTTVFPAPLSLAATFDPETARAVARATAVEMSAAGSRWTFSPNVDLALDPRWGRMGETFGENPLLVGALGRAMVEGYQDPVAPLATRVIACLKHLIGGGASLQGLNFAPMDISERSLRETHLRTYFEALAAQPGSVMLAHNELNGIPCHANPWLVQTLLHDEGGFAGFTVSDWTDVSRLATVHRVAANQMEAVFLAVEAGLDMNMHGPGFFDELRELVQAGRIAEARIDQSVRRLLRAKFSLGLFDTQPGAVVPAEVVATHRQLALDAARHGLVLLTNQDQILPLSSAHHPRVLLTGPLADHPAILGDWVLPQPEDAVTTVQEGIAAVRPEGFDIKATFTRGLARHVPEEAFAAAVAAAAKADVIVACVGDNGLRYDSADKTSGENVDRSDIDLPGNQAAFVHALVATGKPVVVVLIGGRMIGSEWLAQHAAALLWAGEPGAVGGRAVAEALFGLLNPSGRLPVTVARSVGHVPSFDYYKSAQFFRKFALGETGPLFPFGHGLSYTTFRYANLRLPATLAPGTDLTVEVDVSNTGDRDGEEVVLLFTRDEVGSVATPERQLQAFQRIALTAGETRTVRLSVPATGFSLLDRELQRVIEPGAFTVMVGGLTATFEMQPPRFLMLRDQ